MENLGILKSAIIALIALFLLLPGPSAAYFDKGKAHAAINDVAFERFVNGWMPRAPFLKDCSMDRNKVLAGPAWDLDMGMPYLHEKPNQIRSKTVKDWLKSGGFSADEPEIPRALRHFYIPYGKFPYLTDLKSEFLAFNIFKAACLAGTAGATAATGPGGGLAVTGGCALIYGGLKIWVNWAEVTEDYDKILKKGVLGINAVDWAFDHPDNPYTFSKAKGYYKAALGSRDSAESENSYSKAWRAVGETMHMISDMTVPAHVRNDGHGIENETYEDYSTEPRIMKYSDPLLFTPCSALDYGRKTPEKDLKTFMKDVATWTSDNFFSRDTITIEGQDTTSNGEPAFSNPKLDESHTLTEDGKTYYYNYISTTNGLGDSVQLKVELATKPWASIFWPNAQPGQDKKVLANQAAVLIPTAIEASSAVLDAFLPRFEVMIDEIIDSPAADGTKTLRGHIRHDPTTEWPESSNLKIKNGAYVKVIDSTGKETLHEIPCPESGDLNNIEWNGKLESSDKITLQYNLGGYVIRSQPYAFGEQNCGSIDYSKLEKKETNRNDVYYVDSRGRMQGIYTSFYDDERKKMSEKGCYIDGIANGLWRTWYESGALESERFYIKGVINGIRRSFFPDGKIERYEEFKDGKLNGFSRFYNECGWLIEEFIYKDDLLVSTSHAIVTTESEDSIEKCLGSVRMSEPAPPEA